MKCESWKNRVASWLLITYLFKEDESEDSVRAQLNVKVKKNQVTSWSLITYLFKENESEDSMGAQSEVVGGEPFP